MISLKQTFQNQNQNVTAGTW